MSIAVVVPTYNRADRLARLVAALDAQDLAKPFEIVVVDDASTDATPTRLAVLSHATRWPLRSLRLPANGGPGRARNAGWRATDADTVVFIDDDCVPAADWLRHLVTALDDHDVAQGPAAPDPDQHHHWGPFSRALGVAAQDGLYETCNIAYRRHVLEQAGGFDETFRRAGEDADLGWRAVRAGARVTWAPAAMVHTDVEPSSWRRAMRDTRRWGGVVELVARYPQLRTRFGTAPTWNPAHRPALLSVTGMLTAAVLRRHPRAAVGVLIAAQLPYARFRLRVRPLPASLRRRILLLPAVLAVDLSEYAVIRGAWLRVWARPRRTVRG